MIANTFVVGFERSGTTSLHHTLASHPQVWVSLQKEPNHWCFGRDGEPPPNMTLRQIELMHKRSGRTAEDYARLFEGADQRHRAVVDVSPSYARFAETAAPRIAAAVPDARIICVVRHPVDHARSLLATWLGRHPTPQELTIALGRNQGPPAGGPGLADHGRSYAECLRPFFRHFPRDQVMVGRFGRLRGDLLSDIQRFLGLDPMALKLRHDNASGPPIVPTQGVAGAKRLLRRALPAAVLRRLLPLAHRCRSAAIARPPEPLTDELREHLVEHLYLPMVDDLEQLAEIDLSVWRPRPSGRRSTAELGQALA